MSDTEYTFEHITVSKDFIKEFDINYKHHHTEFMKQLITQIETKYNIKITKKNK